MVYNVRYYYQHIFYFNIELSGEECIKFQIRTWAVGECAKTKQKQKTCHTSFKDK